MNALRYEKLGEKHQSISEILHIYMRYTLLVYHWVKMKNLHLSNRVKFYITPGTDLWRLISQR
jgi:hypothetical protein